MNHPCRFALSLAALLVSSQILLAQAAYTATRPSRIQAGVAGLYLNSDYADNGNKGILIFGNYDFNRWVGVEADIRFGGLIAPSDIGENSYSIGPRATYRRRNLNIYAKVTVGRGTITNQITKGASSFNVFGYGGGVEYRIARRFNLRLIDAELQKWPDFEPHTLSPIPISAGIAYIIH